LPQTDDGRADGRGDAREASVREPERLAEVARGIRRHEERFFAAVGEGEGRRAGHARLALAALAREEDELLAREDAR